MMKFLGLVSITVLFIVLVSCHQSSNQAVKLDLSNSSNDLKIERDDLTKITELIEKFRTSDFRLINTYKDEITELASKQPELRQETIKILLKNLDTDEKHFRTSETYGYWAGSVLTLGDLKSIESIKLLGDLIDLNNGLFSYHLETYPCAIALMKIGDPALETLFNIIKLKPESGRMNRVLAVMVISQIGGKENKKKLIDLLKVEKDSDVANIMEMSIKKIK